ncbi:MAG: hypothetical protein KDA63_21125, partial [Planctomycetales bacterium]|nr:hypothetical protein [Planctomycetales bacterium]
DTFDTAAVGGRVPHWNVYDGIWAPVGVAEQGDASNHTLRLEDRDPYDYARAVRVFPEGTAVRLQFRVLAEKTDTGELEIEVVDRFGNRPVRLALAGDGKIVAYDGSRRKEVGRYEPNEWYEFDIRVDATVYGSYDLAINGNDVFDDAALAEAVLSVERLSLRTGPFRTQPTRETQSEVPEPDLVGADEPVPAAVFYVDDVRIESD